MNKELTIKDLLEWVTIKEVKRAYDYHYADYANNCAITIRQLKAMSRRKHENKGEKLELTNGYWPDMFSRTMKEVVEDRYYHMATNKFGLSFRRWAEIASIPISHKTINHYSFEEIVAHFIWEIRFYGSEKQAMKMGKDVFKTATEAKSGKGGTKLLKL